MESVPVPPLGPADALVRVAACGICGSDLPRIRTTGTYHFPTIPGHEMSGTVMALGSAAAEDAPGLVVGAAVAVIPLIPCRSCRFCEVGAFAQCERYDYLGSRCNGGFAEYLRAPAANLVPLPAGLAVVDGAMLEPVAVALHVVRNLSVAWGESAAVFGLGAIGNFVAQWARAFGASRVFGVDVSEAKIAIARAVGLEDSFLATGADVAEHLRKLTDGQGVDVAFEASGSPAALGQAIASLRAFGRLGLVGRPAQAVGLEPASYERILRAQLSLRGTWAFEMSSFPHHAWEEAARAMAEGAIRVGPLVTHRIALEELPSMIEAMASGAASYHKVLVIP